MIQSILHNGSFAFMADDYHTVVILQQALISQWTLLQSTRAEYDANVIAVALCELTAGV